MGVINPPGVAGSPGSAQRTTQYVSKCLKLLKWLRTAKTAATGDDNIRIFQSYAFALFRNGLHQPCAEIANISGSVERLEALELETGKRRWRR